MEKQLTVPLGVCGSNTASVKNSCSKWPKGLYGQSALFARVPRELLCPTKLTFGGNVKHLEGAGPSHEILDLKLCIAC